MKHLRLNDIKAFFAGALLISAACTLTSCDVHQFPEPKADTPELPEEKIKVPLHLVYSPDFYLWEHYYDPLSGKIKELYPDSDIYPEYPGTSSKYDNTHSAGIIDVNVKVYPISRSSQCVLDETFSFALDGSSYDTDIDIELPVATSYSIAVWSHLREHEEANAYYNHEDFRKISVIGDFYAGNTDYRDGFSGMIDVNTSEVLTEPLRVDMTRPMGKFEFVTIDLSEFLDRETTRRSLGTRASADEYHVVISFPYYYPSSYSLFDDRLENAVSGVSFQTKMIVTGETEASLGFEYVLLNDISDAGVQAKVDIYDPSYTHVAGSTTLTIPMRRDNHTLLRGEFLSQEGEGGVGLDPGFNGDHNVIW